MYGENWQPIWRNGEKMRRRLGMATPCSTCPKVPEDAKIEAKKQGRKVCSDDAAEWTPENYQTWAHYWATKAGANPPQDALSREVCGLLEQVVSLSARKLQDPARVGAAMAAILRRK